MKKQQVFTFNEFLKQYPTEDACLEKIFQLRFGKMEACPKCAVVKAKYYRMKKRKCYECGECGHQIYPLAGTVMRNSTTKLTSWFYIIYLFSTSKNGVSSKEIQRQIGVTYKTAWRMGHMVRKLMKDDNIKLSGIVEVDESLIGGRAKGKRGWGADNKVCLLGMVERGGKVLVQSIQNRSRRVIIPLICATVMQGSMINTDEFKVYRHLKLNGYKHETVVHSKYQWRKGDCCTNTIEGYWSNLKKSILGTHTFVSQKWLDNYLNEFGFRYNYRKEGIFEKIIKKI
jgi:transposase-like protein